MNRSSWSVEKSQFRHALALPSNRRKCPQQLSENLKIFRNFSRNEITLQDPNEDSEWNDVLRQKGILPPKPKEKEISENDIIQMLESTIQQKQS